MLTEQEISAALDKLDELETAYFEAGDQDAPLFQPEQVRDALIKAIPRLAGMSDWQRKGVILEALTRWFVVSRGEDQDRAEAAANNFI